MCIRPYGVFRCGLRRGGDIEGTVIYTEEIHQFMQAPKVSCLTVRYLGLVQLCGILELESIMCVVHHLCCMCTRLLLSRL
jgi:hypothetical protein